MLYKFTAWKCIPHFLKHPPTAQTYRHRAFTLAMYPKEHVGSANGYGAHQMTDICMPSAVRISITCTPCLSMAAADSSRVGMMNGAEKVDPERKKARPPH